MNWYDCLYNSNISMSVYILQHIFSFYLPLSFSYLCSQPPTPLLFLIFYYLLSSCSNITVSVYILQTPNDAPRSLVVRQLRGWGSRVFGSIWELLFLKTIFCFLEQKTNFLLKTVFWEFVTEKGCFFRTILKCFFKNNFKAF